MVLTDKDKRIIGAFIRSQGRNLDDVGCAVSHGTISSKHLSTDGRTLDINGLGGRGVAKWINDQIHFGETGGKSQETIHRFIQKNVPSNWLSASDRGSQRDKSRSSLRPPIVITRKKYSRTKKGVKVKKSQYRVKVRDPAFGGTSPQSTRTRLSPSQLPKMALRKMSASQRSYLDEFTFYRSSQGIEAVYAGEVLAIWRNNGWQEPTGRQRDPGSRRGLSKPQSNTNLLCPVGTQVQTLILSKNFFNQREAKNWISRHDFRISKIDETSESWRFRQQPPNWFEKESFRTIRLRSGVQAVIGCPG